MNAKRWSLLTLVALWLVHDASHAQQPAQKVTKHSLWKVQGASNTVYLFGSIHFLKKSFYPLPAPIEDAYKQSSVTVFEVDFDEMKSPEMQLKMVQQGKYAEGDSIKKHLS